MRRNHQCHIRPPERKELSNNPVKMCNEIAHLFRAQLRSSAESDDTYGAHGTRLVLSFLAIGDGVTQLDLVNATHLRAPTISVILKKLEEEGLVERKKDANDLRASRVYLTDLGRELDRQNIERIKQADALALRGLSDAEIQQLMLLLSRIRDNILSEKQEPSGEKEDKEGDIL